MQVGDIMTEDPACCTPETSIQEAARLMVDNDCGCVPVVESEENPKPVGVITDRDICCRAVAEGKDATSTTVGECMTAECVTVTPQTSVEDCCNAMEENQIRRAVVVDERGSCCGMVAQADIARQAAQEQTSEVVRDISQPTEEASRVGSTSPGGAGGG